MAIPAWAKAPSPSPEATPSWRQAYVEWIYLPDPIESPQYIRKPLSDEQIRWREHLRFLAGDDFATLDEFVYCESGYKNIWNFRHDENPDYFTAFGIFQITAGTALRTDPTLDRLDPYQNIELGVKLYRKEGKQPWMESRRCWE